MEITSYSYYGTARLTCLKSFIEQNAGLLRMLIREELAFLDYDVDLSVRSSASTKPPVKFLVNPSFSELCSNSSVDASGPVWAH